VIFISNRDARIIQKLFPPFGQKVISLLEECNREELRVKLVAGSRTFEEQARLYAQGRTEMGQIVTRARPGESWHNYAVAIDCAFKGPVPYPSPQSRDGAALWAQFGSIAKLIGFEWGGEWGWDYGHCQLTYGVTLDEAQDIYRRGVLGGLYAVKKEFSKRLETQAKLSFSNESNETKIERKKIMEQDKAYSGKILLERLKLRGIDIAEEAAKALVEETLGWVKDSAAASDNKIDDVIVGLFPPLEEYVYSKIDEIDGKEG